MALVTRTLNNTGAPLYSPAGVLLANVDVTFTLVDKNGRPTDAWDATTDERVVGVVSATTDASGLFSVALWPNSRGNRLTKYLCHVDYEGVRDFSASVDAGVGALAWVDFMASGEAVSAVGLTALGAHLADATAAHAASAISVDTSGDEFADYDGDDDAQSVFAWLMENGGGGGGGSSAWGDITGTLADQTDLADALTAAKARSNHTGTQAASTISDFSTAADARISAAVGTSVQAYDADLGAIAGLSPSNDDILQRKAGAWTNRTPAQVKTDLVLVKGDVGLGNVDNTSDANKPVSTAQQTALDLKANLASPNLTGTPTAPTASANTNTTQLATTAFVMSQVASAVAGLLEFKGSTDASGNPNYPAADKGDSYVVTVAGKIGGASGKSVDIGDLYVASADNAGGTEASVGTSWFVLEHNLAGALLAANNLSDLASASTARSNLGLGDLATVTPGTGVATALAVDVGTDGAPVIKGGALGTPSSGTLTNATGLPTAGLVDDAVTLAKMASGTAGNLITYDASGNPAAVATGTATHVLTSNGPGAAPTFQAAAGGSLTIGTTAITSGTDTRILFDDGGVVAEDSGLVWDKTNNKLTVTAASNDGTAAIQVNPGSGSSSTRINNNGTVKIDGDGGTGTNLLDLLSGGALKHRFTFNGEAQHTKANIGSGVLVLQQTSNRAQVRGFQDIELQPGAEGGSGGPHKVQVNNGTTDTLRAIEAANFTSATVTKTADYTSTGTDGTILVDATSGNVTITLEAVSGAKGRPKTIKKIDSSGNTVTIDGNASETIDGATTVVLSAQWASKTIQGNAAADAWNVIASV